MKQDKLKSTPSTIGKAAKHTVDQIVVALQKEIKALPEGFYNSFNYTKTRRTYTHPITLGLLAKILWSLPHVGYVGIDFRLNESKDIKFQPDLVGFDANLATPLLFVDYESPNSSDARIPKKDIDAYHKWSQASGSKAPYVLITTLPSARSDSWQLRYASRQGCNHKFRGQREKIRASPFQFWYSHYATDKPFERLANVYFINIDSKQVRPIDLADLRRTAA